MRDSLPPGGTRAFTPGQGTMAAPWYRLPPSQPPARLVPVERPSRRFLGAVGACAALGVFLVLGDPAAPPTSSQARWDAQPAARPAAAKPAAAVHAEREAREARAERFAAIDETLAAAVEGSRLAATEAHDVALRAFAAQQAARYDELRGALRAIAGRPDAGHAGVTLAHAGHPNGRQAGMITAAVNRGTGGEVAAGGDVVDGEDVADGGTGGLHAERLAALREADGPGFDLLYVRQALALNRALLAELDAVLATLGDGELRDAVEQVRGTIDATMPASDPDAPDSARGASQR